jgi:hypothetical protein
MDALNAWQLSLFEDVAIYTDDELSDFAIGPALPDEPRFARAADGSSNVFWLDLGSKRRVAGSGAAWGFDDTWVDTETNATLSAMPDGPDMPRRPFLMRATGPTLYLLDSAWGAATSGGG